MAMKYMACSEQYKANPFTKSLHKRLMKAAEHRKLIKPACDQA